MGLISGLGRSPGGEHSNPLQYPCLENPTDRGAWRATVHEAAKSRTRLTWLNMHRGGQGAICSTGGVYEGIYCIVLWVNICYSLFQILDPSPKLCHLFKYLLSKKQFFKKIKFKNCKPFPPYSLPTDQNNRAAQTLPGLVKTVKPTAVFYFLTEYETRPKSSSVSILIGQVINTL